MTIKATGELKLNHSPVFVLLQIHGSDWSIHQLQFEKLLEGELGKGQGWSPLQTTKSKEKVSSTDWSMKQTNILYHKWHKNKVEIIFEDWPAPCCLTVTRPVQPISLCFPKSQLTGYVNHWYITTDHSIIFEEQMSDWVTILFAQNEKKFW